MLKKYFPLVSALYRGTLPTLRLASIFVQHMHVALPATALDASSGVAIRCIHVHNTASELAINHQTLTFHSDRYPMLY